MAEDLRSTVDREAARLSAMPAEKARLPIAPGKWSPQEIIGHLVDSASNNHGRFVRAQLHDDLIFPGYDQDAWVRMQDYISSDWAALVALWRGYNHHLSHVIERIEAHAAARPRTQHNLDEIAWKTFPKSDPVTLEYFVRDYVDHMKHHLSQIPG